MADTKERTGVGPPDPLTSETPAGEGPPPPRETGEGRGRWRRPLMIILGLLGGVVIYALAFQQTEVDLTQITSETRQRSLTNILRNLVQPELITYDTVEEAVTSDLAIPCGPPVSTDPRLVVEPSCGDPGEVVTVTGSGFEPREFVELRFIPDTEFDITLRLATTNADSDGSFSVDVTLPDRSSDESQKLLAVTKEPIGSWGNRLEVYTDANENGVEDNPIVPGSGDFSFSLGGSPDIPAVALVNPAGETPNFVTTGEPFDAVNGVARGQTAVPLGEDTSISGPIIVAIESVTGDVEVQLEAPAGFDLTNWRAAVYDGATGESGTTNFVADSIQLSPRISETAWITLDKILETVFLALIATTAGLMIAVPLSFIAARNIMKDISITVTNFVLILIAVPLGAAAGLLLANATRSLVAPLEANPLGLVLGLAALSGLIFFLIRSAIPTEDAEIPSRTERLRRAGLMGLAGLAVLVGLLLLAMLLEEIGVFATVNFGWLGFLGAFFSALGEIVNVGFGFIAALATAGVMANLASKLGYSIRKHTPRSAVRTLNVVLAALAGALWAVIVGQIIDWFYQIGDVQTLVVIPAVIGAIIGIAIALRGMHKGEIQIGLSIYYMARTVFNTLRSIEPLVMAIVFVVWVGAGPFAGALALALHTAAALAKLYSEQVESIATGPIEAVRATGANRLQTIVYAVVPQIVPPYISFTMYRWDINVRMSTILGFVGGGGIGSILQQNINLLQYRAAAVQMLAIAIVVASMDYASSRLRERYV